MKRLHGTGTHNSPMNRDNSTPRPNTLHGGTHLKKGSTKTVSTPGAARNVEAGESKGVGGRPLLCA
jgi:hypothetical protein